MLEQGGLECSASPALLKKFLMEVDATSILTTVETTGWHPAVEQGFVYILADGTVFGKADHRIILRPDLRKHGPETAVSGTLAEWQDKVARYCIGNSRLVFFLSAAFAGPLISVGMEPSGGLHLIGKSRSGKTSALFMAASVWGRSDAKVRQWRATSNGLEGLAKAASDACLLLDEIGQADGRDAADTIYMLANGMGKQRATPTGAARETFTWNLLFITTGEIGLEVKMAEANRSAATGLHVRLVNLEADAGAGWVFFRSCMINGTPAELADHLRAASRTYYGVAGRTFLGEIAIVALR